MNTVSLRQLTLFLRHFEFLPEKAENISLLSYLSFIAEEAHKQMQTELMQAGLLPGR